MNSYRLTKLPNGTRIASIEMPHMQSVSVGIWTAVGGRYEPKAICGISHFIEHLMFKGTKKRTARKITEAVEGVGGYLNAFTTEDHTCYYAKAAAAHLPTLCDVLSDMYLNSQFAPAEIEREREVIREEILMYHDNPSQHVQELLSETLWPNHPLGRPLTGTVDTISGLNQEAFFEFKDKHYNGRTTIVTVAGKMTHDCVVDLMGPAMTALPVGQVPRFTKANDEASGKSGRSKKGGMPRVTAVKQEIEQTHLAMGLLAFGRHDDRRFALKLLSVILGENMSSRLFQKLRERHGFCYSVQSGIVSLDDAGALTIFAGLDPAKLEKAVRLILAELDLLCAKPPTRGELRKAQDYTIGQTLMGLESTTNQMMWMGESMLGYGKVLDPAEIERRLLAVTPEEIRAVAGDCLSRARLGIAVAGPAPKSEVIKSWLE
ncbi:MAG: pitrilysin family protein [Verrucomicrobiota bacterium]